MVLFANRLVVLQKVLYILRYMLKRATLGFSVLRFFVIFEIGFSVFAFKMSGFSAFLSVVVFVFFLFLNIRFSFFTKKKGKRFFIFFFQLRFLDSRPFWFTWCGVPSQCGPQKAVEVLRNFIAIA